MIRAIDRYRLFTWVVFFTLLTTAAGCNTTGGSPQAVCDALIGPIRYTSANAQSPRFAGEALAPDLAVRNRVGVNLGCRAFK